MNSIKKTISDYLAKVPANAHESARQEAIKAILANDSDSGRIGKAFELTTRPAGSSRDTVARQGKADTTIKFMGDNGKVYSRKCEVKINGGRIDSIKEHFIIYSIDMCNSTTGGKRVVCEPIVIPVNQFLNAIMGLKAFKAVRHNGIQDGIAIQVAKRDWWAFVDSYPVKYEPTRVYTYSDFGIE